MGQGNIIQSCDGSDFHHSIWHCIFSLLRGPALVGYKTSLIVSTDIRKAFLRSVVDVFGWFIRGWDEPFARATVYQLCMIIWFLEHVRVPEKCYKRHCKNKLRRMKVLVVDSVSSDQKWMNIRDCKVNGKLPWNKKNCDAVSYEDIQKAFD